jgi:hypothetical protein
MQLFSIEYDQLTLESLFDADGNYVETVELRQRRRIHDLPLQTMAMYREKMQGLNFTVERQSEVSNEPLKRERRTYSHKGAAKAPVSTTPVKSRQQQINEAAASGNIAAAITAGAR